MAARVAHSPSGSLNAAPGPCAAVRPRPAAPPAVLLAALILLLPGCTQTGTPPEPPEEAGPDFDGDAARAFVEGLVTEADGGPRYRIPGTQGQASGAAWLWSRMDVGGWSRHFHNVTGEEYQAQEAPYVGSYTRDGACPTEDAEAVEDLVFHNLWARHDVAGTDRTLLLAAHWDSKEDADGGGAVLGANDGASGVGLLLQWMRHVEAGDLAPPVDLVVAFFDGEDGFEDCHPLAGSIAFAADQPVGAIGRMVLLDMVGDPEARFVREGRSVQSDPALVDLLWTHGRDLGGEAQFTDTQKTVLDDHVPFVEAGVPAVDLIDFGREGGRSGFPPYWHTTGDTLENIDAGMLALVGNTLWATLADPAFVETWP